MRMTPITRRQDGGEATARGPQGLPEWDLSDLYKAPDAPEIAQDLDWLQSAATAFCTDYQGKLAGLDAAAMLVCVQRYERIEQVGGRLMSYAGLRYYQDTLDSERAKFMADMQDRMTALTTPLVFFTLEINRIDDSVINGHFVADGALARYAPVFERMRKMRPYQLSDELETFLHDQSSVGAAAWNRLFDETMAGMRFTPHGVSDGEDLSLKATLNLLTDPVRAHREGREDRGGSRVASGEGWLWLGGRAA